MKAPLKVQYEKDTVEMLKKALNRSNAKSLPHLEKVCINIGIGSMVTQGEKDYSHVENNLAQITGQKPNVRKARLSVSNFKLREGMPVGLSTTLRGRLMYDFMQKLINAALPRVRDFRGISVKGFDGNGNFSLGIKDVTIFPEVNPDNLSKNHGLQINIQTSTNDDHEAYLLLKALGFPFSGEIKPNNS